MIRIPAWEIRAQGRAAQSVRIMNVKAGDEVAAAPCPLDLWPRSSRPGDGSYVAPLPGISDVACMVPSKRGSGQARTAPECAQLLRREQQRAAPRKKRLLENAYSIRCRDILIS